MVRLSYEEREKLPDRDFAVINPRARNERQRRKYPIEDETHARNALSRVSRFGSAYERHMVCRKVRKRFPEIHERSCPMHRVTA